MRSERQVRDRLARTLGYSECPRGLWGFLIEDRPDEVEAAMREGGEAMRDLEKVARRFVRHHRQLTTDEAVLQVTHETTQPTSTVDESLLSAKRSTYFELLGEDAEARVEAVSEHAALIASADGEVVSFRDKVVGQPMFSDLEAHDWLQRGSVNLLPLQEFQRLSVSPRVHEYRLVDLPCSIAGGIAAIELRQERTVTLQRRVNGPSTTTELHPPTGSPFRMEVFPGSLAAELLRIASRLQQEHDWNDIGEVVWFLLTGYTPRVLPIISGYKLDRTVSIPKIQPWLPVSVIARFYQHSQRQLVPHPRSPKLRNLKLVAFALRYHRPNLRISWREVMRAWNAANPSAQYQRPELFQRDYARTLRSILPDSPLLPEAQDERSKDESSSVPKSEY